ncbi:hypothetical protein N473_07520 [Pseudoalteromonas luteoviolacea CPMOR-1]|uniref:Uncharacterized protein n=1 Tax=Pseudoalteromonas luteoviolacea CPMOR-1 TaxID=1365248 RepID=A0A167NH45_9GAMM|nr:hypothetical protein [Pseudoalteromonas luteoviolacea]KZN68266.1 hypothetical protein N473_07520 [Pseudoalteromonas luteoviolacea CPMOR-1]
MARLTLFSLFFLFIAPVMVKAQTIAVKISEDIVYFNAPITGEAPSCVTADNINQWAFSLTSPDGAHLYRALLAAQNQHALIKVAATSQCSAVFNIATPKSIELIYQ